MGGIQCSTKGDVYSFGILLYSTWSRSKPYGDQGMNPFQLVSTRTAEHVVLPFLVLPQRTINASFSISVVAVPILDDSRCERASTRHPDQLPAGPRPLNARMLARDAGAAAIVPRDLADSQGSVPAFLDHGRRVLLPRSADRYRSVDDVERDHDPSDAVPTPKPR